VLIDIHIHTKPASYCSELDPAEMIQRAKVMGLDGVCITEHDAVWSADDIERLSSEHDFPVFRGMEVNTDCGHILTFGLEEYVPGIWRLETLRKVADDAGGVLIAAHPFRRPWYGVRLRREYGLSITAAEAGEEKVFQLVHGVEVLNGERPDIENDFAAEVTELRQMFSTGGSDAHTLYAVGKYVTNFHNQVITEEELIGELRAGNCHAEVFTPAPKF
jgi:hypothetical protein